MQKTKHGPVHRFPLTSEQGELLLAFENLSSVYGLAEYFGRDVSVISRQLKRLAESAPVLEKVQGKWKLTPLGKEVAQWARATSSQLSSILGQRSVLRIGTTREFAARVLTPRLADLMGADLARTDLSILTSEAGIERLLLAGEIDFGFDCGRPFDPSVRYKQLQKESFAVYASPAFLKSHRARTVEQLLELPNLQYSRMSTARYLKLASDVRQVVAHFNDLGAIREACVAGLGWAILPVYSAIRETVAGQLVQVPAPVIGAEYFGVWWINGTSRTHPFIKRAEDWLKKQKL